MTFRFGQYELEVDVERTRSFYSKMNNISDECSCQGCRNYENAVDLLPYEAKDFFNSLGVDMKKATEVFVYCKNDDGTINYGGFYHICGRIIKGGSAWDKKSESSYLWNDEYAYKVSDNYSVSFEEKAALIEKNFPLPVMQIDINADIPWVLDEERRC